MCKADNESWQSQYGRARSYMRLTHFSMSFSSTCELLRTYLSVDITRL